MKYVAIAAAALVATLGPAASKPACPNVSILADATRLTELANGRIELKAEIRDAEIACTLKPGAAKSKLSFWVKSAISPNADIAERTVPYFVAVILDGEVIGKEVFTLALPFANGERKLLVKEKIARVDIPLAQGRTAEDYAVTIGFQLTEEQAEYNRTASR